jgi:rRNA maturation protein Nop10
VGCYQLTYPRSDKIYIETVCSKCGKDVNIEEFNLREWNEYKGKRYELKASDYCPHCGAKMDEEAE